MVITNYDTIIANHSIGKYMPSYCTYESSEYKISVKTSCYRSLTRFFPYLNGDRVCLYLTIKKRSGNSSGIKYVWELLRWDGQKLNRVDVGDGISSGKPVIKIDLPRLFIPGEHEFRVRVIDNNELKMDWTILASFGILERDKIVPYIALTIISLILGAFVGLGIKSLIGC
jgi:hypothetical protein